MPRGLSMMSGSMEPNARKARLTLLKKRAEARARPTWAKRSIGQRNRLRVYNYFAGLLLFEKMRIGG